MINKYKNIIIVAVIIGLALIAYSFLKPDPTSESLLQVTERQNSTQALGDEITNAINQINNLKLDNSIFKDPIMSRLIDHSKPINPENVGRRDPFAPIDSRGSQNIISTTTIPVTQQNNRPATTTTSTPRATTTPQQ